MQENVMSVYRSFGYKLQKSSHMGKFLSLETFYTWTPVLHNSTTYTVWQLYNKTEVTE
jgi:hypothetical protein